MNYAGKFGSGNFDPFSGADIGLGPLLSPHGHLSSPGQFHVDKVSTHAPSDAIIIADAHLLFSGDFKRSGVDLILSHGDREVVLRDYFKGEKRAALASPDGAHLTGDIVNALSGHTQFAQADGSASVAPAIIGHVTKLTGNATAIRNGVSIVLNQGDTVHKGDVVQSGSDSTLGITFIDGSVFGLASNARMVLNEMVYDPNGSDNKSLLSLVQGTISFVAGATAKKGDMKVDTPVATMGIRGTAVLVEIDFEVPGQGGAPPAKFQVLVEPDGTTGSYILFDKTTLTPIATVNQAGTQTIVSGQGTVSFQSSVQLSPDAQKIISDVFSLKFTDLNNPNTKLTNNFTDSIVPETLFVKLAGGEFIPVTLQLLNIPSGATPSADPGPPPRLEHIPGPPQAAAHGGAVTERIDVTASSVLDSISGVVNYIDINVGDTPSVSTQFSSFVYQNAQGTDVTATLTAQQLAAIEAVEVPLVVVQDPNGKNFGTATWTYNIADGAFDFLAAGETLKLTYMARVDNNYAPNNETAFVPFTIVVTGTNDKPTISATGGEITERIGTGNTVIDTVSGTITFGDVDLTDRPVVSVAISTTDPFRYYDAQGNDVSATLTPQQLAAILAVEVPLSVVQGAGNTNNGTAIWTYSIEDSKFDFIAEGEKLVLNYVAQVDDGHGGVISTSITVSIDGADVAVSGTNDVPTIEVTSAAFPELVNPSQPNPTGSPALHTVSGTINFTDVDLTDRPAASAAFTSFTYKNAVLTDITSFLTAAQLAAIAAVDVPLTVVQANGNTNNGSASWSYSAADGAFDFLADGEILALTYTATVDDGHGGVVTKPFTVTVTGSNDTADITSDPQTATIAERADTHNSATPDTASGAITFTDADLTDTHEVKITGVSGSGVMTGLANGTVQLSWLALGPLTDSTDGVQGSKSWSFSAPDSHFDYLADGEAVTLTYTVKIDDHHGGVTWQDIVVTIDGSNDAPEIAAIAQQGLTEPTDAAALTTTIPVTFTDLDLSDVGHTAAITGAVASGTTAGLALNEAALITLVTPGAVTKNAGSSAGSVNLSFSAAATAFDYLAKGEVLRLTYTVTIDDGDGAVTPKTFVVTITGTDDAPAIADIAQKNLTEQTDTSALMATIPVTFTDVDLTDVGHTASITGAVASGTTAGLALDEAALIALVTPGTVAKNSGSSPGSVNLSFAAASTAFDYLATGEVLTLTYMVAIDDGDGGTASKTFIVTITGTNDSPVVATEDVTGAVTEQGVPAGGLTNSGTIALADVDLTDAHDIGPTITASSGALGALIASVNPDTVNGVGGIINWSYSVPASAVEYLAEGETKVEHFTITLDDGHGGTVSRTIDVTVTGTNDAPELTASHPSLTPIAEDAPAIVGQTVASFLGSSITDVDDGAVQGIAITATTGTHGHWEYSTDGTTFLAFPAVSTISALLLAPTDLIKYVPDGEDGEAAAITYLAWDRTTGTSGTTADVSLAGGSTAFSVASDTATVTVASINDAPIVQSGVSTKVAQLANNNGVAVFDGQFFFGSDKLTVSDPDGALFGIAITGVDNGSAGGSWQYEIAAGEWVAIEPDPGEALLLSAGARVRFNGSGSGDTEHLTFLAWDGTDGSTSGSMITIPSETGGTTAFSSAAYSVGAKNDAPIIDTSQFTLVEDPVNGTTILSGLSVTDADAGADEIFEVETTTEHAGSNVTTPAGSGHLAHVTAALQSGVSYAPGTPQPATDKVTLKVKDAFGATDTVNFIFNVGGSGGLDTTLLATSGKDVIFSTEQADNLVGGAGADQFVFAEEMGKDTVADFEPGQDKIDLLAHVPFTPDDSDSFDVWLNSAVEQVGSDTLIQFDADNSIRLSSVAKANLQMSDFILHPGGYI